LKPVAQIFEKSVVLNPDFKDLLNQFNSAKDEILHFAHGGTVWQLLAKQELGQANWWQIVKKISASRRSASTLCADLPLPVRDALFIAREFEGTLQEFVTVRNSERDSLSELFWSNFYLAMYPDLPRNNFDPWLHFLEYGLHEGRTTHPFLNLKALESQIVKKKSMPMMLQYLLVPRNWTCLPNPWMDVVGWISDDEYTGNSNPLVSLLNSEKKYQYISQALIHIEASGSEFSEMKNLAYAHFASRSNFHNSKHDLVVSEVIPNIDPSIQELCGGIVLPGFGVIFENKKAWCLTGTTSDNSETALRINNFVVSKDFNTFPLVYADKCIMLGPSLYKDELINIISEHGSSATYFVPESDVQAEAVQILLNQRQDVGHLLRKPARLSSSFVALYEKSLITGSSSNDLSLHENTQVHLLMHEQNLNGNTVNQVQCRFPNVSFIIYTKFSLEVANLLMLCSSAVIASKPTLDVYSGFLDSTKVIELEILISL
jgi:hypothetical protein